MWSIGKLASCPSWLKRQYSHRFAARRVTWRPVLDNFKGYFYGFSRGYQRPISAVRTVTIWILSNWSGLLQLNRTSLSGIAFLSGPICDRANRVTQACRLKRIASEHDRRSGRIGDFTDHLCPCPSILRWALPCGREGLFIRTITARPLYDTIRSVISRAGGSGFAPGSGAVPHRAALSWSRAKVSSARYASCKPRTGVAPYGHPAGTPAATGVERLRLRESVQRLVRSESGRNGLIFPQQSPGSVA